MKLGTFAQDGLFLMHLAKPPEVTNLPVENARNAPKGEVFLTFAELPDSYSDLHAAKSVLLNFGKEIVTVGYLTRDSRALGLRGYLYRSDPVARQKDVLQLGYQRFALTDFSFPN